MDGRGSMTLSMALKANAAGRTFQRDAQTHGSITAYVQDCFRRQIFCDLTLRGSDPAWSIACHRCVLGAVFPPLRALLRVASDPVVDLTLAEFASHEIAHLIESIYAHLSQSQFVVPSRSVPLAQLLNLKTSPDPPARPTHSSSTAGAWADRHGSALPHALWADEDDWPGLDSGLTEEDEPPARLDPVKLESGASDASETRDASPPPRRSKRARRGWGSPSGPTARPQGKRSRLAARVPRKKGSPSPSKLSPVYPKPINHLDYYNAEKLAALKESMACDCPGLTFGNLIEQQNHFYTAHCQRDFSVCETCGNPVRIKYMEAHRETCAGCQKKPCLCPHCGHHTKGSGTLSTHMFDNHMKVKCKICGQEFVGDKSRRKHDHEKHAQTFDCDHCPLQFNTLYKKRSHMVRVHVPDHLRPYVCGECGQGFLYEGKLKRHKMNKHIRARPFSCRCGCDNVAYNDQSTRNQHENRSHPHHPIVLERLKNPTVKHKPGVRKDPGTESESWPDPP